MKLFKPSSTSDNILAPALSYIGNEKSVKFVGSCLKQDKITFTHGKIVNIYIVYGICISDLYNNYPPLEYFLLGAVNLTKNSGIDKCKYSGYGIGFDRRGNFLFPTG